MQENTDRNKQIYKDKQRGMTYRELEEIYGLSRNTIMRIIYRYRNLEYIRNLKEEIKIKKQ
jgi:Mor family transcriptional regulator